MTGYRELREAEHIYHVTLKNNRSLETFKSFLNAIVKFYDRVITDYLEKLVQNGEIEDVPKVPLKRIELFEKYMPEGVPKEHIDLYKTLRRCLISKSAVINEHRRNIEVVFQVGSKEVRFNLKDLRDILEKVKEFENIMKNYL